MQKPFSAKLTRGNILEKLQEKRSTKTADSSIENNTSRAVGESMLDFVREASSELEVFKFNDMTDFDLDVTPAALWESLEEFNSDFYDDKLKLEQNLEKKHFKLSLEGEDGNLEVKIKLFNLVKDSEETHDDSEEPRRLRVRFTKKRGDRAQWYQLFQEMRDTGLDEILLAPRLHHAPVSLEA